MQTYSGDNDAEEGSISNKTVLGVTGALLLLFAVIPLIQAVAETMRQGYDQEIEIPESGKEYGGIVGSLFDRVERDVPDGALEYAKNIGEYRIRVARAVKENGSLIDALRVLVEGFPKKMKEGYLAEIEDLERKARRQKIAVAPYLRGDALISGAVIDEYNLHGSFLREFAGKVNNPVTVGDLEELQERSQSLRREIALLYTGIKTVMQRRDR